MGTSGCGVDLGKARVLVGRITYASRTIDDDVVRDALRFLGVAAESVADLSAVMLEAYVGVVCRGDEELWGRRDTTQGHSIRKASSHLGPAGDVSRSAV